MFHLGDRISRAEAEDLLDFQLETSYLPPQERNLKTWPEMNSNQRAAVLSFAYNLGAHFSTSSGFRSITRVLNNRAEWTKIRATLQLYRNPGSNVEAGLLRRRNAEADLFLRPVTTAAGLSDEIPQVATLDPKDDEDMLDPALHETDNSVAIGLGVTGAIVAVALIAAAAVWFCIVKKRRTDRA